MIGHPQADKEAGVVKAEAKVVWVEKAVCPDF